jgi:hypothetical protein
MRRILVFGSITHENFLSSLDGPDRFDRPRIMIVAMSEYNQVSIRCNHACRIHNTATIRTISHTCPAGTRTSLVKTVQVVRFYSTR